MNLRQLLDSPAARQVRAYGLQHKWYLAGAAGLFTLLLSRGRKPLPYLTTAQRDEYYGPIRFVAAPTVNNPEAIRITNDFPSRVVWRSMPIIGTIQIHEAAAESLDAALREIDSERTIYLTNYESVRAKAGLARFGAFKAAMCLGSFAAVRRTYRVIPTPRASTSTLMRIPKARVLRKTKNSSLPCLKSMGGIGETVSASETRCTSNMFSNRRFNAGISWRVSRCQ